MDVGHTSHTRDSCDSNVSSKRAYVHLTRAAMATSLLGQRAVLRGSGRISTRASGARRVRACGAVGVQAREAKWAPGFEAPKHLDGTLPADFGK